MDQLGDAKDVFEGWCRPSLKNPIYPEENDADFDFGNAPILAKLPNGKGVMENKTRTPSR